MWYTVCAYAGYLSMKCMEYIWNLLEIGTISYNNIYCVFIPYKIVLYSAYIFTYMSFLEWGNCATGCTSTPPYHFYMVYPFKKVLNILI